MGLLPQGGNPAFHGKGIRANRKSGLMQVQGRPRGLPALVVKGRLQVDLLRLLGEFGVLEGSVPGP